MKILEMSAENRPRERLIKKGASSLSDAELLAVILQKGTRNENIVDLSNKLISKHGLSGLKNCTVNELTEVSGVGIVKACQILAMFELFKRNQTDYSKVNIRSPKDAFLFLKPILSELDREHFIVVFLDTKNNVLGHETASIGTLNSSIVHPREIFKRAIRENANSIIIAHNHPSGDPSPSEEDLEITDMIIEAGKTLGINVLDHIIIGQNDYWNWKNQT